MNQSVAQVREHERRRSIRNKDKIVRLIYLILKKETVKEKVNVCSNENFSQIFVPAGRKAYR